VHGDRVGTAVVHPVGSWPVRLSCRAFLVSCHIPSDSSFTVILPYLIQGLIKSVVTGLLKIVNKQFKNGETSPPLSWLGV
jgi:Fe2+ transport system protein B